MALYADRVLETTTTTGTGTITLGGAQAGYRTFASVLNDGDRVYYTIALGSEWEVGDGVFTLSGTTLTRENVHASSNSDALVGFSSGTKNVFLDMPANAIADMGITLAIQGLGVPQ